METLRGLKSLSDERVRVLLRGLEKAMKGKRARQAQLGHLMAAANWLMSRRPDAIRFDAVDKGKESAHFDEIREEIILDEALRRLPDEIPTAVLCHELQHAYEEMAGRPYTFESEVRSFKAESYYLAWTPAAKVAARVRDANAWHWFSYIYRKRLEFLRGDLELETSTVYDFVKSYLGEAKFDGLQTLEKTLLDVRKALELKEHERDQTAARLAKRPLSEGEKASLRAQAEILEADLAAGRRLQEKLLRERRLLRQGNPLALPG